MAFFCTIYESDPDFPYKIPFVKEIELEYVGSSASSLNLFT